MEILINNYNRSVDLSINTSRDNPSRGTTKRNPDDTAGYANGLYSSLKAGDETARKQLSALLNEQRKKLNGEWVEWSSKLSFSKRTADRLILGAQLAKNDPRKSLKINRNRGTQNGGSDRSDVPPNKIALARFTAISPGSKLTRFEATTTGLSKNSAFALPGAPTAPPKLGKVRIRLTWGRAPQHCSPLP